MRELLVRNWWALALRGAAAVVYGGLVLLLQGMTVSLLVGLFAAHAFADGLLAVVAALRPPPDDRRAVPRREALLLGGTSGLAAGLVAALWPDETAFVLLLVVAGWALATGAAAVAAAARLRGRGVPGLALLGLAGALSLALGTLLLVAPIAGLLDVVWWVGAHALVVGGLLLLLALRLRGAGRTAARAADEAGAAVPA